MNIFEKAKIHQLENAIGYTPGSIVSKQVIKNDVGNVTLFSFDKGQALTEHTASYDALVQVLDGEVEIKISGEPYRLKKGECIIMPANIPHGLVAVESFKMLLTMIRG